MEKERKASLERYNQWRRKDIDRGMYLCSRLEDFLNRLNVTRNAEIIPLDWPDQMEWMYEAYRDRVNEQSKSKANQT